MDEILRLNRKRAGGAEKSNTLGLAIDNSNLALNEFGKTDTVIEEAIIGMKSVGVGLRIVGRVKHSTFGRKVLKLVFDGVRTELDEIINLMMNRIDETRFNSSTVLEIVDTTDGIVNSGGHSDSN
jgi:hypothetical protein